MVRCLACVCETAQIAAQSMTRSWPTSWRATGWLRLRGEPLADSPHTRDVHDLWHVLFGVTQVTVVEEVVGCCGLTLPLLV